MKRKITALAAIVFAVILGVTPVFAINISEILSTKSITLNSDPIDKDDILKSIAYQTISGDNSYCWSITGVDSANSTITIETQPMDESGYTCDESQSEQHVISVQYTGVDQEVKAAVEQTIEEAGIAEGSDYTIEDESFIEYANDFEATESEDGEITIEKEAEPAIEYTEEMQTARENLEEENIEINETAEVSKFGPFYYQESYSLTTTDEDGNHYVGLSDITATVNPVIYISADTEDTTEAYIEAASQKIESVLGEDADYSLAYGGKISEDYEEYLEYCENNGDICTLHYKDYGTDDYYILIINKYSHDVLILKEEGGKGGDEESTEKPIEETTTETVFEGEPVETSTEEPEDVATVETASISNNYIATSTTSSKPAKTEEKTEPETTEEQPVEEKAEEPEEESEEKSSSPLPVVVSIAVIAAVAIAIITRRSNKKYSK